MCTIQWPLAFLSIAGGLWTLMGRSIGGAFLVGLAYGAAFYFTHLMWVVQFLGPIPWVALAGVESLLFALGAIPIALAYRWGALLERRATRRFLLPVLIAVLWAARELGANKVQVLQRPNSTSGPSGICASMRILHCAR